MPYAPPLHMYDAAYQYHYPYYDPTTDDWDITQWRVDDDAKSPSSPESPTTSPSYQYLFEEDSDPELDSPSSDSDSSETADEWLNAWLEWNPTSSPDPLPPLIELPEIDEDAEDADLLSAFPEPPTATKTMAFYPENYTKRRRSASMDPTLYPREIRTCIDRWITIDIDPATGTVRLLHPTTCTSDRRPSSMSTLYPLYIFVDAYDAIASLPDLLRELDPRDLPPEVAAYHGHARWLIMREASWYVRAKIHQMDNKIKEERDKKRRREASVICDFPVSI